MTLYHPQVQILQVTPFSQPSLNQLLHWRMLLLLLPPQSLTCPQTHLHLLKLTLMNLTPLEKEMETVTPIPLDQKSSTMQDTQKEISSKVIGRTPMESDSKEEDSSKETPVKTNKQDSPEENFSTDVHLKHMDISDFVKSEEFQKRIQKIKVTLTENMLKSIEQRPQAMKEIIFQILSRFPDILDNNNGQEIIQYIQTNDGPVQVNKPLDFEDISNPEDKEQDQTQNDLSDQDTSDKVENPQNSESFKQDNSQDNETQDNDTAVQGEQEKSQDNETQDNEIQDSDNKEEQDNYPKVETNIQKEENKSDGDDAQLIEDSDSDCFLISSPPQKLVENTSPDDENEKAPPTQNDEAPPTETLEPIPSTSQDNTLTLDVSPRVRINRLPYLLHSFHFDDIDRDYDIYVKEHLTRKRHTGDTDSQNSTKPKKDRKHKKHTRDKQK